jgi:RIO-like serine/threonine protein kinase
MHERGVVHLDLRQRRNVIVTPDARPAILDFGGALCLRPGSRLFAFLAEIDRSGVLKYKNRALPGSLSPQETQTLQRAERIRRFWPFS